VLGQPEEALALQRRALAWRERLGEVTGAPAFVVAMNLGVFCAAVGRYGEALAHLEAALARFRAAGETVWVAVAENQLATALLFLGQPARARRVLGAVPAGVTLATRTRRLLIEARVERALGKSGAAPAPRPLAQLDAAGEPYMRAIAMLETSYEPAPPEAVRQCTEAARQMAELEHHALATRRASCSPTICCVAATPRATCTCPRPGGSQAARSGRPATRRAPALHCGTRARGSSKRCRRCLPPCAGVSATAIRSTARS
jgi:tetratricopeptide (TPR) repeat protein